MLKLALCEILLDRAEKLSETKSRYERDTALVKVGEHYQILNYLHYDRYDPHIPQNYAVSEWDDDDHKYIATAVEAVLGAIYKTYRDMRMIVEIVRRWMQWTDANI